MLWCRESDSDISHSHVTYSAWRRKWHNPGNHSPSDTVSYLSLYFCSAFLTAAVRLSPGTSLLVGKCPVSWLWGSLSAATLHPLLKPPIFVCWLQLCPYCTSLSLTETSAVNQIPHTGPATLRCKLHLVNNNSYNQTQLQHQFMQHPIYSVTYSVLPTNSSLSATTLYSLVRTTLIYTKFQSLSWRYNRVRQCIKIIWITFSLNSYVYLLNPLADFDDFELCHPHCVI